jgi:hypothetical protein
MCVCVCVQGEGRGGEGGGLYDDVPTGASKLCACRVNGGTLLGLYLYQKGAYGYGGERQDDEGSEDEALSRSLIGRCSPPSQLPSAPLSSPPGSCEGRFLGANREKPHTFVRAVNNIYVFCNV